MKSTVQREYHLVGVAGVGMSALAQVLVGAGHVVSGSDRHLDSGRDLDVLRKLRSAGVALAPQDGSAVREGLAGVVVSTAIEADNPDLAAARAKNIPVIHRARMLAALTCGRRLVAVSGTSGKTTVTGLLGHVFERLGRDPTVVNGGAVVNWRTERRIGNVRLGQSGLWIVEVDESDRSLLEFEPDWAVLTNISKDHFELDEVVSLFTRFVGKVRSGVVCGPGVASLVSPAGASAGPARPALAELPLEVESRDGRYSFWYRERRFRSPLIGRHNAENACAAVALCDHLGLDLGAVEEALESFRGIERRLEVVGEGRGIAVVDDYAHNPAKIAAGWRAVAERHQRVLGAWRPHGYGPLRSMLKELADTFAAVCRADDRIWILPVYYAGGTAERSVGSDDLVAVLRDRGVPAAPAPDYDALFREVSGTAAPGDCVLCMGARDPDLPAFARRVAASLAG